MCLRLDTDRSGGVRYGFTAKNDTRFSSGGRVDRRSGPGFTVRWARDDASDPPAMKMATTAGLSNDVRTFALRPGAPFAARLGPGGV